MDFYKWRRDFLKRNPDLNDGWEERRRRGEENRGLRRAYFFSTNKVWSCEQKKK